MLMTPEVTKINKLAMGIYECRQARVIDTAFGKSHVLSLREKRTGEEACVFGNSCLNGYISSHPDEKFEFTCEGENSFKSGDKQITYVKISNFNRIVDEVDYTL